MTDKQNAGSKRVIDIAAEAYYFGSQGVPSEDGLEQIDEHHSKLKNEIETDRADEIGQMEAHNATLTHLESQAHERWEQMRLRYKEDPPRVLVPLAMLVVGLLMVGAEATLLAPALDMLGISDPLWQLAMAATTSLGSAVLMHLALEAREKRSSSEWPLLGFASSLLLFLAIYGIWRAKALTFSATHSHSPIAPFLADSPALTNFVIGALTVVIPVAAAFAAHYALRHLWQWWEFGKACRNARALKTAVDASTKETESAKEKLSHDLDLLDHQNREWQAQYKHYWALGRENGAKKGPSWPVWAKSAAVALGVMVCGVLLWWLHVPGALVCGCVAGVAAGLAAAVHFYRRWEHPTPEEFLKRSDVQFSDAVSRKTVQEPTIVFSERRVQADLPESRELVKAAKR